MFVRYTPKIPHIKVIPLLPGKKGGEGYTFDNDSVTLRPGTNEFTEKEWEAIQPHIKDQLGKEIVAFTVKAKPGKGGGKGKKAKTLKDVPVATARKIIQACQDPKTLKKWFNQELPDEILLVLSKQMRKLKIEPDDIKDDDADALKDSDITPEDKTETSKTGSTDDDEDIEDDAEEDTGDDEGEDDSESDEDDEEIPDFDGSQGGK
jgi:hypothetical protein